MTTDPPAYPPASGPSIDLRPQCLLGRAGWVAWLTDDGRLPPVLVRFRMVDGGRLVIAALHLVDEGEAITSSRLRTLPLGRIESAVNSGAYLRRDVMETIDYPEDDALPDLLEQVDRFHQGLSDPSPANDDAELAERPLRRPGDTDSYAYYEEVATQYRLRAARSRKPAALLAEEAGVPVGTVHRWVRDARRLGFLPSGVRGKVG